MCSVAPNPPSVSAYRSEHSPVHKVSWEGEESREGMLEREEEWGARAFELERTQRRCPRGKSAPTHTLTGTHVLMKKTVKKKKVRRARNLLCSGPSTILTRPGYFTVIAAL